MSVVLAATVGACGKAEETSGGSAPAPAASPGDPPASVPGSAASAGATGAGGAPAPSGKELGRCKVDITGDVTASVAGVRRGVSDSKVSIGTDYWMSEDELRAAMRVLAGIGKDKDGDRDAKAAEAMKKDPRLFALIVNCGDGKASVSFLPGKGSKYADVPHAPKKYVVTTRAKAGEFGVMLNVGDGFFSVKTPGTLDITRFDSSRIEGTFAFDAAESFGDKRNIKVTGSFEFDCAGSESCGK